MRILFLTHAFNSLSQRLYIELTEIGHEVSIEFDINDSVAVEAVETFKPDLIVAPFLKRKIPDTIWQNHVCLIVHPGIRGDRGPSSLDWAMDRDEIRWGVTCLQAAAEMDAGDIWASLDFPMREASKSSIYRNEVTEAAIVTVLQAIARFTDRKFEPEALESAAPGSLGDWHPFMTQADRVIDWQRESTSSVLTKIRAADGVPGVLDEVLGKQVYLHDAHPEDRLRGSEPGAVIAHRNGAICRATVDGAVWLGHLRPKPKSDEEPTLKLPAARILGDRLNGIPEAAIGFDEQPDYATYRQIWYREANQVGYLYFDFYNGAMSTEQCVQLLAAYNSVRDRDVKVIVLMGGADFWSNGIHLNHIEAAESAADESWQNINAMNDLARAIICTDRQLTISALRGNAGAGGVFLSLAADQVLARQGVVLNPHYKSMGNLYGSEYWTYLLPRRVGAENSNRLTGNRLPIGTVEAKRLGLLDDCFGTSVEQFTDELVLRAEALAQGNDFDDLLAEKIQNRGRDEKFKPLEKYREEEMQRMHLNFYGFDSSYHVARYHFVYKIPKARTPVYLAHHRRL